MPARKSVWPGNAQKDRRREDKPQTVFTDVFEDCPPTQVPDGALAKAINGWPTGPAFRPRNGTKIFGARYPAIAGRTGYAAHKVGNQIISDSGDVFTEADVSNIWVWDNGLTDEMTGYVNAQIVNCRDDDANTGVNCHVQGKLNLNKWHDRAERWIVQLGQDFYTADRYKTAYELVHIYGRDLPANAVSEMVEDGDDALVQNARYLYRIELTKTPVRAFPITTPIPNIRITSNDEDGEKNHKYRYVYSAGNLDQGSGNFYHRETPVKIISETGTNTIDENRRDWTIRNTEEPIGPGTDTYGRLVGAGLAAAWDEPGDWDAISDITFTLDINGLGAQEILIDGTGVVTLDELAERIQGAIRLYFPSAVCRYISDAATGPHFEITTGLIAGGTILQATAGVNGTDSAANLGLTAGAGAVVETPYLGVPHIIRNLRLPIVQYVAGNIPQWHHTHYHLYRTFDLGPDGMDDETRKSSLYYSNLNVKGKRVVNSPDEFVWNKDLRAAGAFIARRINGTIELRADLMGGEFEVADQGSVIEFEDGERIEILLVVSDKLATYTTGAYYSDETDWMAACIGNGKAVRITKTGTTVTRTPGSSAISYTAFTAADVRKPVWFPNGARDFIREVVDANTITVYSNFSFTGDLAMTYDPSHRNYCDIVYDSQLYSRTSAWFCKNRFMREVKPSNLISKQPGFMLMAARGGKELWYCPLESSYKYFLGYHVREHQSIEIDDIIERVIGFTNRYSVLCKGTIHTGATNNSIEYTIPETFQKIWILAGVDKVSSVGLISYGGMDWVDDEWVRFVTNTGEIREFNGVQFRESVDGPLDFSEEKSRGLGRMKLALKQAYKEFNSIYSRGVGYILWWRDRT